jgi:hypothetical protein
MTPWQAALVAGALTFIVVGAFITLAVTGTDAPNMAQQIGAATGLIGTPLAIAAAIVTHRVVPVANGRDLAARYLSVATAGLPPSRREWGKAMLSELESIDGPGERFRFAFGCSLTAVRLGTDRRSWLIAMVTAVVVGAGTLVVSRASLGGHRSGIMGFTMFAPQLVLLAAGYVGARWRRSFRAGMEAGALALLAALFAVAAVEVWESVLWYDVAGVYVVDGDAAKTGLTVFQVALDPIGPTFIFLHLMFWTAWPVIGAGLGARRRRHTSPAAMPLESVAG